MYAGPSDAMRKSLLTVAFATAALLVALVAMRFTDEVNWTALDFIVAGCLLFGSGAAYVLIAQSAKHAAGRAAACIAVAAALMLVWVNLAVGINGSEDNPANLMYAGVTGTGIVGAVIARLRPRGMSVALLAAAIAQALVAAIALAGGLGRMNRRGRSAPLSSTDGLSRCSPLRHGGSGVPRADPPVAAA